MNWIEFEFLYGNSSFLPDFSGHNRLLIRRSSRWKCLKFTEFTSVNQLLCFFSHTGMPSQIVSCKCNYWKYFIYFTLNDSWYLSSVKCSLWCKSCYFIPRYLISLTQWIKSEKALLFFCFVGRYIELSQFKWFSLLSFQYSAQ